MNGVSGIAGNSVLVRSMSFVSPVVLSSNSGFMLYYLLSYWLQFPHLQMAIMKVIAVP